MNNATSPVTTEITFCKIPIVHSHNPKNTIMEKEEMKTFLLNTRTMDHKKYLEKREELWHLIDGEIFYSLKLWPSKLKRIFWHKPLNDAEVFKMFLFLYGNGCEISTAQQWIISSLRWTNDKTANKRLYQLLWILQAADKKKVFGFTSTLTGRSCAI